MAQSSQDVKTASARTSGAPASECVQRTIQLRERGVDPRLDLRRALRGPVLRQLAEGSVLHRSHPPFSARCRRTWRAFRQRRRWRRTLGRRGTSGASALTSPGRPTARGYRPFECKYRAVQAHRRRRPEAPARRLHRRERQRQVVAQHRRHRHRDLHLSADALLALRPAVRRLVAPLLVQSSRRHVPACKGLGKRTAVDVDRLLNLDRSIEEGAIRELPRIGLYRPFQLRRAPVGAAPDLPLGPRGEPPFDLVEPGGAVRREVQVEPPQRPPPTRRS